MTAQPGPPAGTAARVDEIVDLLFEVVGRLRSHFDASAVDCGIPPAQAAALQQMDRPVSMRELAARLECDPSNVTGITDRLEARRLVERRSDPTDRRVKHLVLTRAGAELRDRLQARLLRGPAPLVGLSETDQEALRDLLRRALDRPA
jgi:DNA-binding MarR family transcriptional regulator